MIGWFDVGVANPELMSVGSSYVDEDKYVVGEVRLITLSLVHVRFHFTDRS